MIKYLLLPMALVLALIGVLLYVGNQPWVQLSLLSAQPDDPSMVRDDLISTSLQLAILAGSVFFISVLALWSALQWAWKLPSRVKSGFGMKRAGNGLGAIEEALIFAEAGDGAKARKHAKRARELLSRPALTNLISAKAAMADGQSEEAKTYFTALSQEEPTQIAGLHGLAELAFKEGQYAQAVEFAHTAYSTSKASKWAFDYLLKSQIALNDWNAALKTIDLALGRKHIQKSEAARYQSVLLSALAHHENKEGNRDQALVLAEHAAQADAGFAPAIALAATLQAQNGQEKKAINSIEKAWKLAPHPALSLALRDLLVGEKPSTRTKKLSSLAKSNADNRESILLLAEIDLDHKNHVGALSHITELNRNEEPSARVCQLAAACEAGLGNLIDARAWEHRAANAPIEANWSDLDPDGPAFAYTQTDWQRLVVSYGEHGKLIHPRLEAAKKRKAPIMTPSIEPAPAIESIEPSPNVEEKNSELDVKSDTTLEPNLNAPIADYVAPIADDAAISDAQKSGLGTRISNLLDKKNG